MAKLTGQTIASSYDQLLIVNDADGISSSLQAIESADTGGSVSSLKISTSKVEIIPASNSTSLFEVSQADGTAVLSVDTSNARVGIGIASPAWDLHIGGETTIFGANLGSDGVLIAPNANNTRLIIEGQQDASIILVDDGAADNDEAMMIQTVDGTTKFRSIDEGTAAVKDNILCLDHGTGQVGIGTASPDGTLHAHTATAGSVSANANADDLVVENSGIGGISILTPDANSARLYFGSTSDNDYGRIIGNYNSGSPYLTLRTSVADTLVITSGGNVGIGTTSPQYSGNSNHTTLSILNSDTTDDADRPAVLELAGNNKGNGVRVGEINFWQDVDGGDDLIVSILGAQEGTTSNNVGGKLRLQTKADGGSLADRLVITEAGNVGIGTASPDGVFHVESSDMVAYFNATETYSAGVSGPKLLGQGKDSGGTERNLGYILFTSQGSNQGEMRFAVRNSSGTVEDKMIIDDAGNVGIGTASPSALLEAEQDQNGQTLIVVDNNTAGTAAIAGFQCDADAASGRLRAYSSSYTTSNYNIQDSVQLAAFNASGGLTIITDAGDINFWTGSTPAKRMLINSTGKVAIGDATSLGASAFTGASLTVIGDHESEAVGVNPAGIRIAFSDNATESAELSFGARAEEGGGGYPLAAVVGTSTSTTGQHKGKLTFHTAQATGNSTLTEVMVITDDGNVGIGTASPVCKLDIAQGGYTAGTQALHIGADSGDNTSRSNSTTKYGVITFPHYNTSEEHIEMFSFYSNNTDNILGIGGNGNSAYNSLTAITFRVGANDTTTSNSATTRMKLDNNSRISLSNNDGGTDNTLFGDNAGNALSSGHDNNTLIGDYCGDVITADANTGVGKDALGALTNGTNNVAVGYRALLLARANATGNVAIGKDAIMGNIIDEDVDYMVGIGNACLGGDLESEASGTVAIGTSALAALTNGAGNVAIGYQAADAITTGNRNIAIGYTAFSTSVNSSGDNIAIGYNSMNGTGTTSASDKNIAIGNYTMNGNQNDSDHNIAIGHQALNGLTTGDGNVSIGGGSGYAVTDVDNLVLIGKDAGAAINNSGADGSVAIGGLALNALTSGERNLAIGYQSLQDLTDGDDNVMIGYNAGLDANSSGFLYNVGVGNYVFDGFGSTVTAAYNTAVGHRALSGVLTSDSDHNTALGYGCLGVLTSGDNNVAVGSGAGDAVSTGHRNILIGKQAGYVMTTEDDCVLIGHKAGFALTETTSNGTVAIGYQALTSLTSGARNIAIGYDAGNEVTNGGDNVFIGYQSGTENNNFTTGDYCTMVGNYTDASGADGQNQTAIGYDATGQADNSVTLGNADVTAIYCAQDSGATVYAGKFQVGSPAETPALGIQSDVNNLVQHMDNGSTSGNVYIAKWKFTGKSPDDNTSYYLSCEDAGYDRLKIWSDGDVNNSDNAYGSISDKRIKQGIRDANSQWDDIKAVKVRNFKKNEDVDKYGDNAWEQIGVIAQELEASGMDKLIKEHPASENEARTGDGSFKEGDMIKSVSYSVLYMKAIKALQEAMAKIETLESKVAALEG